jgi:hypothetical protein
MTNQLRFRALFALAATQAAFGCSRFVWKEDPFTPDKAPTTEIIASGRDTTYVLRRSSYYLLAQQRDALWNREVMDDVAWRYRALFGESPPPIAIALDTMMTTSVADTTWRGLPFATVAPPRRPADAPDKRAPDREPPDADDAARVRLIMRPMLAATAAETWLKARALAAAGGSMDQPGGPERPSAARGALPAWMEAGSLRIMASGGAPDRAAAELRANQKGMVALTSLFAVTWQRRPNALEIARGGAGARDGDADDDLRMIGGTSVDRRGREPIPGVSPLFIAQSVSVLAFLHERDVALIARLADDLPRGASIENVLASSTMLPHSVAGLEAEWRKWLQRSARRR